MVSHSYKSLKKIILNDCSFVGNGSTANMRDATGGAAFSANSPVVAIGCKFIGKENKGGKYGGIVKLTGAWGNSAFTKCVWFGNADTAAYTSYDTRGGYSPPVFIGILSYFIFRL